MSQEEEQLKASARALVAGDLAAPPAKPDTPVEEPRADTGPREYIVPPVTTTLAAMASGAAAAVMVAGLFRGPLPLAVALGGVVLGGAIILLAFRLSGGTSLQYALLPAALVVGAILVAPDARGGTFNLPTVVADAVRSGGLLQPPVAFDPGWRFILVVVFAIVTGGAALVGIGSNRPKLAVFIPVPITAAAALNQPSSLEVVSTVIAMVLTIVGISLAYGAELRASGQVGTGFELRRLAAGGGVALGLAAAVVGLNSLNVLFPTRNQERVIPPQKPQTTPPGPDKAIFTYTASQPGMPLRLGVIDTYDVKDFTWKLPASDDRRLRRMSTPSTVPGTRAPAADKTVTTTFTILDLHGHTLPSIADPVRVSDTREPLEYDPVTQSLRVADRPAFAGLKYTVTAPSLIPPTLTAKNLMDAGKPEATIARKYLVVPNPPAEVVTLVNQYSEAALKSGVVENDWDRLAFMRNALLNKVIAAGAGAPREIPPSRVAEMLRGGEANPFEITAAEALIARWAGVPSRIGYGYYGGTQRSDGSIEIRPKNGAMFLESYFKGYGWVPLVGLPPKAKPSTSQEQKNEQQNIKVSDDLALEVYVLVKYPSVKLLYEYVRYWIAFFLPWVALLVAAAIGYPAIMKFIRTLLRNRWAHARGYPARVAVAYCEFRDLARDLTVGDPGATPAEFIDILGYDAEHDEFAWLVTRALWADLARDLRIEDVVAAERMGRNLRRRLWQGQPFINQVLSMVARTSLREPFSTEVPNFWFDVKPRLRLPASLRALRGPRRGAQGRRRRLAAMPATGSIIALLVGCGGAARLTPRTMPTHLVPDAIGTIRFERDTGSERAFQQAGPDTLVSSGRVYLVKHDDFVEGSVQLQVLKPDLNTNDMVDSASDYCISHIEECPGHELFKGIQRTLNAGTFHRLYDGDQRAYEAESSDQRSFVWFPPRSGVVAMLFLRSQFTAGSSRAMLHSLLEYERGKQPPDVPIPDLQTLTTKLHTGGAPVGAGGPGAGPAAGSPKP